MMVLEKFCVIDKERDRAKVRVLWDRKNCCQHTVHTVLYSTYLVLFIKGPAVKLLLTGSQFY
jgi:hypothetical protein